jgi:hypothetical protein
MTHALIKRGKDPQLEKTSRSSSRSRIRLLGGAPRLKRLLLPGLRFTRDSFELSECFSSHLFSLGDPVQTTDRQLHSAITTPRSSLNLLAHKEGSARKARH